MAENTLIIEMEKMDNYIIEKLIKSNIKKYIDIRGVSLFDLSKETKINIMILIYIIYVPYSKIKLSKAIMVCKALGIQLSDIII